MNYGISIKHFAFTRKVFFFWQKALRCKVNLKIEFRGRKMQETVFFVLVKPVSPTTTWVPLQESFIKARQMKLVCLLQSSFCTKQFNFGEFYFMTNVSDFLLEKFIRSAPSIQLEGEKGYKFWEITFPGEIVFQLTIHWVVTRMCSI